jgi:hypothetical protein
MQPSLLVELAAGYFKLLVLGGDDCAGVLCKVGEEANEVGGELEL